MLLMTLCSAGNCHNASYLLRAAWSSQESPLVPESPSFGFASMRRLFPLDRFQVLHQALQPDISKILIRLDLVKDGTPDGHFPRAMRCQYVFSWNGLAHTRGGKLSSIVLRQYR